MANKKRTTKGLSILITTNNVEHIDKTLKSINDQSYKPKNFEVIVGIDGCSTCEAKLDDLMDLYDWLYVYVCPENKGTYLTRNTLIKESEFDDILFFDSDDTMYPHMLDRIYKINDKHQYDLVNYHFHRWEMNGNNNVVYYDEQPAAGSFWIKRYVMNILGGFKSWRYSADSEFMERFKSSRYTLKTIEQPLFIYRRWDKSLGNTVPIADRVRQRDKIQFHGYYHDEINITPEYNDGDWL